MALRPIASSPIASSGAAVSSAVGAAAPSISEITIWNEALSAMGARARVSSPTENSPQARECALRYSSVRDTLLRSAPWDFAERTISAGLLKAAPGTEENTESAGPWSTNWPPPPWLYMYLYPADCVRMLRVKLQPYARQTTNVPIFSYSPAENTPMQELAIPFKRSTDFADGKQRTVVLTNAQDALFVYTARVTNPALFDVLFTEALVNSLASELCIPLAGAPGLANGLAQKANNTIMTARLADANEGLTVIEHVPDFLRVRGVSSMNASGGLYAEPYGPLFGVSA